MENLCLPPVFSPWPPRALYLRVFLSLAFLCLATPSLAQTTATLGEKSIGTPCSNASASADYDTLAQCSATSGSGTMKKAPLFVGAVTSPPYVAITCDSTKSGMLQYTASGFSGCTGSSWYALSSFLGSSAAATSPARSDDVTTGLFSASASTVSIATAGTERLRITASGNVGIGTTSPMATISVSSAMYSQLAYFSGNTGATYPVQNTGLGIAENFSNGNAEMDIWNTVDPGTYVNTGIRFLQQLTGSTFRDLMFLSNTGNVGIGTTAPTANLDVRGTGTSQPAMRIVGNSSTYWPEVSLWFADTATGGHSYSVGNGSIVGGFAIADQSAGVVRLAITSTGSVGIGTTAPSSALQVTGTVTATALSAPNAPKAWVSFTGATATIKSSYGVSSVTRLSTGVYKVTWAKPFASANYAVLITSNDNGSGVASLGIVETVGTESATLATTTPSTLGLSDASYVSVVAFGE